MPGHDEPNFIDRFLVSDVKMVAALVATRPSTWSAASMTYHLSMAANSPAVKNRVDMLRPFQ